MDTHVKVLGVPYIICGVLGIVVALGALVIAGVLFKAVEQEAGPEAPQARFAIAGVFGFGNISFNPFGPQYNSRSISLQISQLGPHPLHRPQHLESNKFPPGHGFGGLRSRCFIQ